VKLSMALLVQTTAVVFACAAAHAGEPYAVPQGCTAYATVQHRNCQVSQHYRCGGDPDGTQWATYLDGQGPYFSSQIDFETRWVDSLDMSTGETDKITDEADPASFSTLLQSGRDDFDFKTISSAGEVRRYVGYDQLTGTKVTIGGQPLEQTRFALTAYAEDGTQLWKREGQQFIHRDWRIFFSDREEFTNAAGDRQNTIDSPVEFALPGDKGFLSQDPKFDCDVVTARADIGNPLPVLNP
jgi:hypothetical protein